MHLWKKKLIVSIKGYVCAHDKMKLKEEEEKREKKTTNECAGQ